MAPAIARGVPNRPEFREAATTLRVQCETLDQPAALAAYLNPLLKEAGLTKPTAAVPCRGWGGDWYVWHAPDGLRARAATALGCMQAGAEKLGVIEASYASAIIGDHAKPRLGFRAGQTRCVVRPWIL